MFLFYLSVIAIEIETLLGTTKSIVAEDSREFSELIAKYIDSQSQGRADRKRKRAEGTIKPQENKAELWPLIRQVKVTFSSETLGAGVVLVDLPGVADSNAARCSIAKNYLKTCDCIWILAPITRAVDDKVAKGQTVYLTITWFS